MLVAPLVFSAGMTNVKIIFKILKKEVFQDRRKQQEIQEIKRCEKTREIMTVCFDFDI